MAVISNSTQTLAAGAAGNWWTPTASTVALDIDNAAMVCIETRRGSSDAAVKPLFLGVQEGGVLRGPCSVMLSVVVGRDYRFKAVHGAPVVAAQE